MNRRRDLERGVMKQRAIRARSKKERGKMLDSVEYRWKKERQMWWWHLFAMIFFVYLVVAVTTILVLEILEITKR